MIISSVMINSAVGIDFIPILSIMTPIAAERIAKHRDPPARHKPKLIFDFEASIKNCIDVKNAITAFASVIITTYINVKRTERIPIKNNPIEHTKMIAIDTKNIDIALIFFERSANSAKNGCKINAHIFAEAKI